MKFIEIKNNINLEFLNNQNNIFFDEILISLFEILINSYFKNLSNKDLIQGLTIKYLEKSIKILTKEIEGNLNHLGILYAITFIKCYFYKLSNEIYSISKSDKNLLNIININKLLSSKTNTSIRNVIKIYILKCFYSNMQNYNEFINFEWEKNQISWAKNFIVNEKNSISNLQFLFLNMNIDSEILKKYNEQFNIDKKRNNFNNVNEDFYNELINKDYMTFIDISINIMLSEFLNPKYFEFSYEYFCNLIKIIYEKKQKNISKILKVFFDKNFFENLMRKKIFNLDSETIEILLYSYKFSILASLGKENSLYSNLLSQNFNNIIKNLFIPWCRTFSTSFN